MHAMWKRRCWLLWLLLPLTAAAQPTIATRVGPPPTTLAHHRIGLLADAQYCDCDADKGRYYRLSLEKLHQAVDSFNGMDLDMVINLGDLIDQRLESYPKVKAELARLKAPCFNVVGNHEFWEVPYHMQEGVLDSIGMRQGYCDVVLPGWRILILDGTELAAYAQGAHKDLRQEAELCQEGLYGHANNAGWNGALGQMQMRWLDRQLSEADHAAERVLLFCHFPVSPPQDPMTLWNDADVRDLLKRHPSVEAWFAGHSHIGHYERRDSIHHLTLSGMLMSPDSNAFAVLNLQPAALVVEGFGREPYRWLPLRGVVDSTRTIAPEPKAKPDAVPPAPLECMTQIILDQAGQQQFSAYTEPGNIPFVHGLGPGLYALLEYHSGRLRVQHLPVFPKN